MLDLRRSVVDHDSAALHSRALRRRQRYTQSDDRSAAVARAIDRRVRRLFAQAHLLQARYALHLLVVLLVPMAVLASQSPLSTPMVPAPVSPSRAPSVDIVAPLSPLSLDSLTDGDTPVPDSAFAAIDALPPDLLQPKPIAATVAADSANLRGGPGTEYDKLGALPAGTALHVLAQANGWYQARLDTGRVVWLTAELLRLPPRAVEMVPEATTIPALPPARIGLVAAHGLNLRDGPGTVYVGMTRLTSGSQLELLARYNDWFQVQTSQGQVGWVLSQYLSMAPGVLERVDSVTSVPSPNPALLGQTSERNVNLRGGPGAAYPRLRSLGAGVQLTLIGRYTDWLKVRTPGGATGWISNELVNVEAFIARRVPVVRNIPALPKPAARPPAARPATPARARPAPAVQAPPMPAASAGGAVSYALQFVGSRYSWGGNGPSGFDCSGFTQYIYKQYGLTLPHSSGGQYSTAYGTMISNPADLRPGDLVFFANTYKRGISHVGIYIGGGEVVQALSPRQGVGVASLNGGYWTTHYYGAIRPSR